MTTLVPLLAALAAAVPTPTPVVPTPTAQQPLGSLRDLLRNANGKVTGANGDWAEYAPLDHGKPDTTSTFRVIAVDDEKGNGRWLEMWQDKRGRFAIRVHLERDASRDAAGEAAVLLKFGPSVFALDKADLPEAGSCTTGQCTPPPAGEKADYGGKLVPLRTIAGTFQCLHMNRGKGSEAWYSEQIPILQLARYVTDSGFGYEIVATGHGGESSFPKAFKANPLDVDHLQAMSAALKPHEAPKEAAEATACDPKVQSCAGSAEAAKPAPAPVLQPFSPPKKDK